LSVTVTTKLHDLVFAEASVARHTTVVLPRGKVEPLTGPLIRVSAGAGLGQLSVAVTEYANAADTQLLPEVLIVWFAGQLIVGACVSFTVTRKVQVFVKPDPSVARSVIVVTPLGNADPEDNPLCNDTTGAGEQLSVAVALYVATAAHWPTSAFFVWFCGQVIVGASPSVTVTVNEQLAVKPAPSVAFHATTVTPLSNTVPLAPPLRRSTLAPVQLSDHTGAAYEIPALHKCGSVVRAMLAGQAMTGGWLSTTVTVKLQTAVRPAPSVDFQLISVVPLGKAVPLAGPRVWIAAAPQLSVAATPNDTTAVH